MKISIAIDTWNEINGVTRSFKSVTKELEKSHECKIIHPGLFRHFPMPFYPELPVTWNIKHSQLRDLIDDSDHIHIATENTLGLAIRQYCLKRKFSFTTSYLTKIPEYVHQYTYIPQNITRKILKWFHSTSSKILVATESMRNHLIQHKFKPPIVIWEKGLDTELFSPQKEKKYVFKKPLSLYVGRVSQEKNIEAFLDCPIEMQKIVVGDGPIRKKLQQKYPSVIFTGYLQGQALTQIYSDADVFVFPSKTDTFGLVILEALACGTPVAGFPVPGPIDIIGDNQEIGCLDENLAKAINTAISRRDRQKCREFGLRFSWTKSTQSFLSHLVNK